MAVIPDPALVWLVGPSGSGKTTWALERFRPGEVVSSDSLREAVGSGQHDLEASADAFAALELIATARLARGMTAVVDSLGFDRQLRGRFLALARQHGIPTVAVVFETPKQVCRVRNSERTRQVPAKVLADQFRRHREVREEVAAEGWEVMVAGADDVVEAAHAAGADAARRRQMQMRRDLSFFLQVSNFEWVGDNERLGPQLGRLATVAEGVGFDGISVMDHLIQIPQVGRSWDMLPESLTTLAYLAGATDRLRLSNLVTNVTLRPPALLGKVIATLDLLSGGRAECGLGAGWFEKEQIGYGIEFPPAGRRVDYLEDTLRLLPLLWGPGGPSFSGKLIDVPEAVCYPRPLQENIPIIVGGSGDRTLRLAAELADGCNMLSADLATRLPVVRQHLEAADRPAAEFLITVLDVTVCGRDRTEVGSIVESLRGNRPGDQVAARLNAGSVSEQIGRYRLLAEQGVGRIYVSLANLSGPETVEGFAPVVAAFA